MNVVPWLRSALVAGLALASFSAVARAASAEADTPKEVGRVGLYVLADVTQAQGPGLGRLVAHTIDLAQPLLGGRFVRVNAHGGSDAEIAAACRDGDVNAIFVLFARERASIEGSRVHELAESHLDLFDCFGDIAFDGAGTAEAFTPLSNAVDGSYEEAKIATDRAFTIVRDAARADPSSLANLVRFGFPIDDGVHTAGLQLRPGALGALAIPLKFGSAARAGIRHGDLVTAINGRALAGLGDADLRAALSDAEGGGGTYTVAVTGSDGKSSTYTLTAEDLAGYVRDLAADH